MSQIDTEQSATILAADTALVRQYLDNVSQPDQLDEADRQAAAVVEQQKVQRLQQAQATLDALAEDWDTLSSTEKRRVRRLRWRIWKLERALGQ